jgi:hypothetical protein
MSILGVFNSRVSGKFYLIHSNPRLLIMIFIPTILLKSFLVLQEEMHDGLALAGEERRQH